VNGVGSNSRPCVGCGAPLPTSSGGPGPVICAACGRPHSASSLAELDYLDRLEEWVPQRRAWLEGQLAEGAPGPPVASVPAAAPPVASVPAATGSPVAPPPGTRGGPSVGTVLLVIGAVALVGAAIAFVALAWDLLGPIGQVVTILVVGLLSLLGATRIPERLRGTAETVGAVGASLIVVAAVACRVLGVDALGPTGALAASVLIGVVLGGCAFVVRRRLPVAGELASVCAVVLVSVLIATGPVGRALPIDRPWTWWVALVMTVAGAAVILVPSGFRTWGVLGPVLLIVGVVAAVASRSVGDDVLGPTGDLAESVLIALVLGGYAFFVRRRFPEVGELASVCAVVLLSVLVATGPAGRALPIDRPWTWWVALVMTVAGIAVILVRSGFRTWGVLGPALLIVGVVAAVVSRSAATGDYAQSVLGPTGDLAESVLIALVLGGYAFFVRRRFPVVAELASVSAVVLVSVLVATGPVGRALPIDPPWTWWVALVMTIAGTAVILVRSGFRTWGVLGAALLFVGAVAWANAAEGAVDTDRVGLALLVWAAMLLVAAVYVFGLALIRRNWFEPLALVATVLVVLALARAIIAGLNEPQTRPYAATVVAMIALLVGLLLVVAPRLGAPTPLPRLQGLGPLVLGPLAGIVVALLAAPWGEPTWDTLEEFGLISDDPATYQTIAENAQAWVAQNWTTLRAAATAVAFVLLLVLVDIVVERARRGSRRWGAVALSTTAVGLGYWLLVASQAVEDLRSFSYSFDRVDQDQPILRSVAAVLGAVAVAAVVESLRRALPVTALIGASVLGLVAMATALSSATTGGVDDPDLWGLMLALPLAIAGLCAWWLTRPRWLSSWLTIAPALVVALLWPTTAVLSDFASHTALGEPADNRYQIRVVALLTVAAVCAVVGARQRLAGAFWPGLLCLLVVAATQLVEVARFVPQWVSLTVVGVVLVLAGARWEDVRTAGRRTGHWVGGLR